MFLMVMVEWFLKQETIMKGKSFLFKYRFWSKGKAHGEGLYK